MCGQSHLLLARCGLGPGLGYCKSGWSNRQALLHDTAIWLDDTLVRTTVLCLNRLIRSLTRRFEDDGWRPFIFIRYISACKRYIRHGKQKLWSARSSPFNPTWKRRLARGCTYRAIEPSYQSEYTTELKATRSRIINWNIDFALRNSNWTESHNKRRPIPSKTNSFLSQYSCL